MFVALLVTVSGAIPEIVGAVKTKGVASLAYEHHLHRHLQILHHMQVLNY